ncbi:hypothetical protein DFH07DRAFT_461453 [Mycena maculata]|uniref:F-box domain-containing protein n=1 Tax=Mycena maculata TaxID=230809 RepID=A0AAD7NEH6_9AGAR|nr:hypothetical protein DFH07DRAFT_461453 [Mycena maculata]
MDSLFKTHGTDVRDHLRHNILPSNSEKNAIIESVTTARRLLSKIGTVESFASDMLRCYISDYSSLVSPIRRLPDDILETIFLHPEIHDFVKLGRVASGPSFVVDRHKPHIIASVSHHWREVAVHAARLWSSFSFDGCRGEYTLRDLRLCLDRSKDAALDFTLDLSSGRRPNPVILDEITKHSERWVKFTLVAPPDPQYLQVFAPVHGRLHRLEAIVLGYPPGNYDELASDVATWNAFEVAPRLTVLQLAIFRGGPVLPLPAHQIETISFVGSHSGSCGKVFSMFPHAREMAFISSGPPDFFYVPDVAPEPHLATRRIILGEALDNIPDRLNTPNLEELRIIDCLNWSRRIIPFMTRSACSLQTLVVHNTRVRGTELLALLRQVPTLDTLVLTELVPNSITDLVLGPLTPLPGSPATQVVLPALTRLVVAGVYLFSTQVLMQMLEARHDALVLVHITLHKELGAAELERFAAFQTAGSWCLQYLDDQMKCVRIQKGKAAQLQSIVPAWCA